MSEIIISYDDAVKELKQLLDNNWRIGEIADRVAPAYGGQTLQHLAWESGIEYKTLLRYRDVYRAWPEPAKRFADLPWSVHMIFASQPDRFDLIRQKQWTASGARVEVQRRRREVRRQQQESYESIMQRVVKGLTARFAEMDPPPWAGVPDPTEEDYERCHPEWFGVDMEDDEEDRAEDEEAEDDDVAADPWLFTKGNKKVGKNVLLWNVPVVDCCPGATISCVANCYANNDHCRRPKVKRRHAGNLEQANADNFCERAIVELRQRRPSELRIHSAGDFYSPEYTRKWLAITAALPNITFWVYTRSWRVPTILTELVRLASLPNVHMHFSCDRDTGLPDAIPESSIRACWLQIEDELPPEPAPGQMAIDERSVAFRTKREGREPATRIGLAMVCPTYNDGPKADGVTCETCKFCYK